MVQSGNDGFICLARCDAKIGRAICAGCHDERILVRGAPQDRRSLVIHAAETATEISVEYRLGIFRTVLGARRREKGLREVANESLSAIWGTIDIAAVVVVKEITATATANRYGVDLRLSQIGT